MKLLNRYRSLSLTARASVWFVFATLFQKGINIITTPIFTRLMSKAEYGSYSVFNTWYNIFLVVCTFNLAGGIFNTVLHRHKERKEEITSCALGLETALTFLVFGGYLIYYFTVGHLRGDTAAGNLQGMTLTLSLLMFAQVLVNIPTSLWIAKCKYEYNYFACCLVIILQSLALLGLSILLVVTLQDKVIARIIANLVIMGIVAAVVFVLLLRQGKKLFSWSAWKYLLLLGLPLLVHYLAQDIMAQSDQLVLDRYRGKDVVATYSLAHQISWIFTILTTAINTTFVPWVYRKIDERDFAPVKRVSAMTFSFICTVTLCVSLVAPEAILLFGGNAYLEGARLVPLLISNVILITAYDLFSNVEFFYSKTVIASLATVVCAAFNITFNFVIIPRYGMIAACCTTLASYALLTVIHYVVMRVFCRKKGLPDLFGSGYIWLLSAVMIALNLATLLLQEYRLVRFALLAAILALLIVLAVRYAKKRRQRKEPEQHE